MKKIFMAVILTAIAFGTACTDISAKKSNDGSRIIALMQKYDGEKGVEAMNINGFLLGIAKAAAKGEEGSEWLKMKDEETISEMVMVAGSEASVILMRGQIPLSEMGNIIADQQ